MSVLRRRSAPAVVERQTLPAGVAMFLSGRQQMMTPAGVYVDQDSALRHDAVWACVNRIAQPVAALPVDVIRRSGGTRTEVTPTPQIVDQPSLMVDRVDWTYQMLVSLLLYGNAWGDVTEFVRSGNTMLPSRIEPRHPDSVSWRTVNGVTEFYTDGERRYLYPVGDLWHVSAYTMPGTYIGLSPIVYHATMIGSGLAAEKFGAQFFGDGAHPSAIVSSKTSLNAEQAKAIKESFQRAVGGTREPAVFGADLSYQPVQVTPEDSQFLDTMRYTGEAIARVFGLDPTDIGLAASGSSVTYANREQRQQDRLVYPIGWWMAKLERAWSACLPRPQVVKFNPGAFLRADFETRHRVYDLRLTNGTMNRDEVRALEDEPPLPNGLGGWDDPEPPDDEDDDEALAEMGRSLDTLRAEVRNNRELVVAPNVTVHLPESRTEVAAPIVNVAAPEVRAEAPIVTVNVDPTPVTVQVSPTPVTVRNEVLPAAVSVDAPVTVNVDPTPVTVAGGDVVVNVPDSPPSRFRVRRDGDGRISEVIEE